MNKDLKIIKKKYGEAMMHLCRDLFPTLLETEGLLPELLMSHFHESRELYQDITDNYLEEEFKDIIYSFVDVEEENIVVNKSAKELLEEAGYDLYQCMTEEEIQSFKKYYAKGEELCTFRGGRLNSCYVFFAVKKDVEEIRREDYSTPRRQDEYGTSVISIQFRKDKTHTLSIKNRYNHKVNNPDSTFANNLDNIIPGLMEAFAKDYGMVQEHKSVGFELPGYVQAYDGKYYKYNYEMNNIYYCPGNIIIDNFEVKQYEREKFLVFDYFILDLQNKKIMAYDESLGDSFPSSIDEIEKIEVKHEDGNKIVEIFTKKGPVRITLNALNQMVSLEHNYVKATGSDFLAYNYYLKQFSLPEAEMVGESFLCDNEDLEQLSLPKARQIGKFSLFENRKLKGLDLPEVEAISGSCFMNAHELEHIYAPKLEYLGSIANSKIKEYLKNKERGNDEITRNR